MFEIGGRSLINLTKHLFKQSNDFFRLKNGLVLEINSLCGTRTFTKFGYLNDIKAVEPQIADITIIRDEKERLLSAYNKKIIAKDDWKKFFLRMSIGVDAGIEFSKLIQVLISRKNTGKFIDKHFMPCSATGNPLTIEALKSDKTLYSLVSKTIERREKNSLEVSGKNKRFKKKITNEETKLILKYMDLYNA